MTLERTCRKVCLDARAVRQQNLSRQLVIDLTPYKRYRITHLVGFEKFNDGRPEFQMLDWACGRATHVLIRNDEFSFRHIQHFNLQRMLPHARHIIVDLPANMPRLRPEFRALVEGFTGNMRSVRRFYSTLDEEDKQKYRYGDWIQARAWMIYMDKVHGRDRYWLKMQFREPEPRICPPLSNSSRPQLEE